MTDMLPPSGDPPKLGCAPLLLLLILFVILVGIAFIFVMKSALS